MAVGADGPGVLALVFCDVQETVSAPDQWIPVVHWSDESRDWERHATLDDYAWALLDRWIASDCADRPAFTAGVLVYLADHNGNPTGDPLTHVWKATHGTGR